MSESEHRQRLRDLMSHETNSADLQTFLEELAASNIPLAEQLGRVLDLDNTRRPMPGRLVAILKIHELAPAMIRHFNKIDEGFEGIMVQLIGHLDHEDVVPFFLALLQTKRDSYFRGTVLGALKRYTWQSDMLEPLLRIAQNTAEDSNSRQIAIRILASQPSKSLACSHLLPLLKDSDGEVRLHALIYIKDLGDSSHASYVEPLLTDTTTLEGSNQTIGSMAHFVLDTWARKST